MWFLIATQINSLRMTSNFSLATSLNMYAPPAKTIISLKNIIYLVSEHFHMLDLVGLDLGAHFLHTQVLFPLVCHRAARFVPDRTLTLQTRLIVTISADSMLRVTLQRAQAQLFHPARLRPQLFARLNRAHCLLNIFLTKSLLFFWNFGKKKLPKKQSFKNYYPMQKLQTKQKLFFFLNIQLRKKAFIIMASKITHAL